MAQFGYVRSGWGWKVGKPVEIISSNSFGNVLVKNDRGVIFRIKPEELECDVIANSAEELAGVTSSPDFVRDWNMTPLVSVAEKAYGPLADGEAYQLVIPSVLGGAYTRENMRKNKLVEVVGFSGDIARQVDQLPPGTPVRFRVTK